MTVISPDLKQAVSPSHVGGDILWTSAGSVKSVSPHHAAVTSSPIRHG